MADGTATPRKRSLVLAGGGMRVAYQAGVVQGLYQAGLTFDHADGSSGGIMNLAMLLSGRTPEEMCERWRTLEQRRFVSLPPARDLLHMPDAMAWGSSSSIRDYVFPHLGIDVAAIRAQRAMTGTFNVCNFSRKVVETITNDAIDLDLLVAGISLPILMPPVQRNGDWYTDAVWIMDSNVLEAARRGADEIWLIWCIGNTREYHAGAFQQYVHMIEMAANGSLGIQLERVNEMRNAGRNITLHVIKPEIPLPLDPDYYLGRISGATLVEMGYADASRYLATMKSEGVPFTPEVTQMQSPAAGVTFNETMEGHFALGLTDPKKITSEVGDVRSTLSIHVTVHIDDIDKFVTDIQHPGRLTGRVEFAPFGGEMLATTGVFKLFSPTDDPRLTYMVYELGFKHAGEDYYLAGHKEVRDDPGIDLWSDTTTLYTQLHSGKDSSGPVIGAGVLRLGAAELASLVASMRTTGTRGPLESTASIAKFGKFFLRELWSTYAAVATPTRSA